MPQTSARKRRTPPPSRAQQRRAKPTRRRSGDGLRAQVENSLSQVYVIPGFAILPLRFFLGITFIYAGIQKLTDPGFFTPGSVTYIGTQITNFGRNSPIHFLMTQFAHQAVAIGVLTIMTEMIIGILVTIGLFTRVAAVIGLSINFIFFLSASWSVYPYFLGSDIVFCVCWLTLAITGPGALSLDPLVTEPLAYVVSRPVQRLLTGTHHLLHPQVPEGQPPELQVVTAETHRRTIHALSRREAIVAGLGTFVLFWLALIPRGRPNGTIAAAPSNNGVAAPTANAAQPTAPAVQPTVAAAQAPTVPVSTPAPAANSAGSLVVGNISQIAVNSALSATDPKTGDPAVVIHGTDGKYYAYDAVCTHAGCTVQYDPSYKLLLCPCHGGAFDPLHGAQVVQGPPPAPLTALPIHIDSKGNITLA
jgi:thiosulfate dehydrogenase [quinone] large subunit